MRKLLFALALTVTVAAPLAARADFIVEGSVATGRIFSPEEAKGRTPTSVMLAPGLTLAFVHLQLGIDGILGDTEGSSSTFSYRPMVTVMPPILPLYGRLILAFTHPFDSDKRVTQYGGALGVSFGLPVVVASVHVFGELGLLPASEENPLTKENQIVWIGEARAGVGVSF
jgi:hypothetical protein